MILSLLNEGIKKDFSNIDASLSYLEKTFLTQKIKFPLLEFLADHLSGLIPDQQKELFLKRLIATDALGSYVIAGKLLQNILPVKTTKALELAEEFIISGDAWFVCDIVGERVFGHALLTQPELSIKVLKGLTKHSNSWMLRVIGVAAHYAIKNGLRKNFAEEVFEILLSLSQAKDFHTKKGIGWAAKTAVKFYPDFASRYEGEITASGAWFKTKIKIGLGRSEKYAHRYS